MTKNNKNVLDYYSGDKSNLLSSRIVKPTAKALCLSTLGGFVATATKFSDKIVLPRKLGLLTA